jgi:hypothetical protein
MRATDELRSALTGEAPVAPPMKMKLVNPLALNLFVDKLVEAGLS